MCSPGREEEREGGKENEKKSCVRYLNPWRVAEAGGWAGVMQAGAYRRILGLAAPMCLPPGL